jgi:hypothetical protein
MYEFLRITHSILRYVILIGGIGAIVTILANAKARVRLFSTIFLVSSHIQLVIGLLLYFKYSPTDWFNFLIKNPKDVMAHPVYRFFGVEHVLMMLIAIVLITIGHGKLKKALVNNGKLKTPLILFILALVIMLAAIPWPFRGLGRGWL